MAKVTAPKADRIHFYWHCPECDWRGEISVETEQGNGHGRNLRIGDRLFAGPRVPRDLIFYEQFVCPRCASLYRDTDGRWCFWDDFAALPEERRTQETKVREDHRDYVAEFHCFGNTIAGVQVYPLTEELWLEEAV